MPVIISIMVILFLWNLLQHVMISRLHMAVINHKEVFEKLVKKLEAH